MSRKQKAAVTAVALVMVAAVTAFKIRGILAAGRPVLWLEELWAPAAFLSIGLVTCLEFLLVEGPAPRPRKRKKA